MFKKNDVIAIVYLISGLVRIVRVVSTPKGGATIRDFRTYPSSKIHKYLDRDTRLLTILGDKQENARRLFEAATQDLDYSSQDEARNAIKEA